MSGYVFETVRADQLRANDRVQWNSPMFRGKPIVRIDAVLPSNQPEFTTKLRIIHSTTGAHNVGIVASERVRRVVRSY